jgi:hypothetical protein
MVAGAYAPMCRIGWGWCLKFVLYKKIVKTYVQKNLTCRWRHSLCLRSFFLKNNIFCFMCKKTKFGGIAWDIFLSFFFRRHMKYRFSVKLGVRICSMRRIGFFYRCTRLFFEFFTAVHVKVLFAIIYILIIFFWSHEHMLRYAELDFWTTKTTFKEEISTTFLASCLRWRRLYHFLIT